MKTILIALALVLAGCGGSDEEEPDKQAQSADQAPDKSVRPVNCQVSPEMCL